MIGTSQNMLFRRLMRFSNISDSEIESNLRILSIVIPSVTGLADIALVLILMSTMPIGAYSHVVKYIRPTIEVFTVLMTIVYLFILLLRLLVFLKIIKAKSQRQA
ncbi:MAG: hypothetical protein AB1610_01895 [Nitrospirota bacterium]